MFLYKEPGRTGFFDNDIDSDKENSHSETEIKKHGQNIYVVN